ncbi:hypothetical protein BDA99DRAFT_562286 [Phascolomyces articulosus]|uniref:Uncharacterized protein n=1 Tax=Phascolomyces articulosus TaxID=60185 RepID=A0AAD5K8L9_9FUNG|nr:hypothetical protein BDA99DRAFT_562286 [Phascolomyces articulosus]
MTLFSNLLAPLTRRRRKVTTTNGTSRSPAPPTTSEVQQQQPGLTSHSEIKAATATATVTPVVQGSQESHVVFISEPRTSMTSSTSVNVESLEFKASQELAVSLNSWDDQPVVMPAFPAFEHLLRQQQEEQKKLQEQQEQSVPRRSLRRLPRPLSLYRSGNRSLKMARSTPNFHK